MISPPVLAAEIALHLRPFGTHPELDQADQAPTAHRNLLAAASLEALQLNLAYLLLLEGDSWRSWLQSLGADLPPPDGLETVGPARRVRPRNLSAGLARQLEDLSRRLPEHAPVATQAAAAIALAPTILTLVDAGVLLQAAAQIDALPPAATIEAQSLRTAVLAAAEDLAALHARLVLANRPLVYHLVRRHFPTLGARSVELDDCIQEGLLGLSTAVAKFRCQGGASFSTYSAFWILERVRRYRANRERFVRIPVNRVQAWARIRNYQVEHPWADSQEISRALELPMRVTRELIDAPDVVRLPMVEEEAEAYVTSHAPRANRRVRDHQERSVERRHALAHAITRLTPAERIIVSLHYDLDDLSPAAEAFLEDWQARSTALIAQRAARSTALVARRD